MIQSLPVVTRRQIDTPINPNLQALQLINRDYISYSAISTYQRCPLKFYFSYVAGLEPEFKSSSLIFGGAIHAAIEEHFNRLFEGSPAPSLDELLAVFDRAWQSESNIPIRFGKTETAESLHDLAGRMLEAFQNSEVCNLDGDLLGVEETFRAPIMDDCPDLLGRIDLITVTRDALQIVDFKTSRSRWSDSRVEEAAPQQLLYSELVRPLAQALDLPIQIEWVVLTKTKQPSVTRFSLTPDPDRVAWIKRAVGRIWHAIRDGHFYPNPSTTNCVSCSYKTTCKQWEG